MTIDEAIARERQLAKEQRSHIGTWYSKIMGYDDEYIKKCEVCAEEHEQVADWLEELKATSCGYSKEDIELNRNAMYNKAIDDFADKIISLCWDGEFMERLNEFPATTILELAEQLKVGGENE